MCIKLNLNGSLVRYLDHWNLKFLQNLMSFSSVSHWNLTFWVLFSYSICRVFVNIRTVQFHSFLDSFARLIRLWPQVMSPLTEVRRLKTIYGSGIIKTLQILILLFRQNLWIAFHSKQSFAWNLWNFKFMKIASRYCCAILN